MTRFRDLRFWLKHSLWFVPCAYVLNFVYAIRSDQTGGTFGDTFGAANALFSGTALLMLVLAVTLQREELQEVKDERKDTKKLLEGQEQLNEAQGRALARQLYEQSLETMLNSIFAEKALITQEVVADNKRQRSDFFNAAFQAARILENVSPDHTQPKSPLEFVGKRQDTVASKAEVYVNLLVVAATFVDKDSPDGATRLVRQQLLKALFQEEVAYCMAWYLCKAVATGKEASNLRTTFVQFGLIELLGEKQQKGLTHSIPDILSE